VSVLHSPTDKHPDVLSCNFQCQQYKAHNSVVNKHQLETKAVALLPAALILDWLMVQSGFTHASDEELQQIQTLFSIPKHLI